MLLCVAHVSMAYVSMSLTVSFSCRGRPCFGAAAEFFGSVRRYPAVKQSGQQQAEKPAECMPWPGCLSHGVRSYGRPGPPSRTRSSGRLVAPDLRTGRRVTAYLSPRGAPTALLSCAAAWLRLAAHPGAAAPLSLPRRASQRRSLLLSVDRRRSGSSGVVGSRCTSP